MEVNGYKIGPGANLQGANLFEADLQYANLEGAILQDTNMEGAILQHANLQGAHLLFANLQYANLQGANLQGANLQGANLIYADLQDADLQDAVGPDGRKATDLAMWLSSICACTEAILWAWSTDRHASLRSVWQCAPRDWKHFLGDDYEAALEGFCAWKEEME